LAWALSITAREFVRLGKNRAFARRLLDLPDENVVVANPLNHLVAGQPLGNGERVEHDLAGDQFVLDLAQADARLERVFASFERASAAVEKRHRGEPDRAVDDALAFELVADRAAVVLASDDDDLVGRQRPGLTRLHCGPTEQREARYGAEQHERQQTAQARKPGTPRPPQRRRRLLRRRLGLRAQANARAEKADPRPGLGVAVRFLGAAALFRRFVHSRPL
jgi:hypothetical protein